MASRDHPGDDESLVFETSEGVAVAASFDAMGLKEDLLRGIYAYSNYFSSAVSFFFIYRITNNNSPTHSGDNRL